MTTLSIIIPVYNEERAIGLTLEKVRATVARLDGIDTTIICVDDGSQDGTAGILAAEEGITVLTHGNNRGYGAALRTGLDSVTTEWAFIVDADGTYPIEELPALLAERDDNVMVVGARQGPGIQRRLPHRFARWTLRKMVHVLTGVMVPDLNSGMRIFKRSIYRRFRHLLPMGFSFTSTITVACLYAGLRVKYVPIHYDHRIGRSNIRPVRDFFAFTVLIVRLASYFEPLTFFIPAASGVFALGFLKAARDYLVTGAIGSLAVILMMFATQVFLVGIVADVVVRRTADVRGAEPRDE